MLDSLYLVGGNMTLQNVADKAMNYLDLVGVAAEYKISSTGLTILTDDGVFNLSLGECHSTMLGQIILTHPRPPKTTS